MSGNMSHREIMFFMLLFTFVNFFIATSYLIGVSPITQGQEIILTPSRWFRKAKVPSSRISKYENLDGSNNMELVVRLTLSDKFIQRMYCDVLRSSSIFWNSTLLGGFLLIFDEADRKRAPKFIQGLESIPNIPHSFRAYYEKPAINVTHYKGVLKHLGKPPEYLHQLYSSFLMDMYTDKPILAWIDTDTAFITPVLPENIMNSKGQLVVKGWNSFDWAHVDTWRRATQEALGVPMVSDFMTYFPMSLHTKTIQNCRNHIIKHLNVSTFEEAFSKLISKNYVSPCNVLMTYAYYFEYDSYEWHIDIKHEPLGIYNKKYCPSKPLLFKDLTPAIHLSAHTSYSISTLERAICNMNYYNKLNLTENCKNIVGKNELHVFQFQNMERKEIMHTDTWCKLGNFNCTAIVEDHYMKFLQERKERIKEYNPGIIRDIEKSFNDFHKMECPKMKDVI